MKKLITITLAALLAAVSLCGCNTANNEDIPSDTTTPKETVDESTPTKSMFYDCPEISFERNEEGECYIYIKEWQAYRKLSGLEKYSEYHIRIEQTSAVLCNDNFTIAIYIQSGKSDTEIITYHFNKNSEESQFYSALLNTKVTDESVEHMINMHSEDHGYFFFFPLYFPDAGEVAWPLIRYETTDGGKTWNKMETLDFGCDLTMYVTVAKFVTHEAGIISCVSNRSGGGRTYLTKDGGLTWYMISNVPVPWSDKSGIGYTEWHDFEKRGDEYILTQSVRFTPHHTGNEQLDFTAYIFYKSKNLVNWEICEP